MDVQSVLDAVKKKAAIPRELLQNMGHSLITLPQRAFESSEAMRGGYGYDPGPIVEAATLPMGTGAVAGVPVKGAEAVLGSGIVRPTKPIGGYHATNATEDFTKFKDVGGDVGTHFSVIPDPVVPHALEYPGILGKSDPTGASAGAGPRTIPVVADIKSVMKYPRDPQDWTDPERVIDFLRMGMDMGMTLPFPKKVFGGMESAAKQTGGLKENLAPTLKEFGYDAVRYPHAPGDPRINPEKYNSYMALNPSDVKMRYSPEGQELIKAKGILEPSEKMYWGDTFSKYWQGLDYKLRNEVEMVKNGWGDISHVPPDMQDEVIQVLRRIKASK